MPFTNFEDINDPTSGLANLFSAVTDSEFAGDMLNISSSYSATEPDNGSFTLGIKYYRAKDSEGLDIGNQIYKSHGEIWLYNKNAVGGTDATLVSETAAIRKWNKHNAYAQDEYVLYDGKLYKAQVNVPELHSTVGNPPPVDDSGNPTTITWSNGGMSDTISQWEEFKPTGSVRWSPSATYEQYSIAEREGVLYVNYTGNRLVDSVPTATLPAISPANDTQNWMPLMAWMAIKNTDSEYWDNTQSYTTGVTRLSYDGVTRVALQDSTGVDPTLAANSATWGIVAEDENSNPNILNSFQYRTRGRYDRGDMVTDRGRIYVNVTGANNNTSPILDTANWKEYYEASAADFTYYDATHEYRIGDLVLSANDTLYKALVNNPSSTLTDATQWSAVASGDVRVRNNSISRIKYVPGSVYMRGDIVGYRNALYVNITGDNGTTNPVDDETNWVEYHRSLSSLPPLYDATKTYYKHEVVRDSGGALLKVAVPSTMGVAPSALNANWDSISPSVNDYGRGAAIPTWVPAKFYDVDDVINHQGVLYTNNTGRNGTTYRTNSYPINDKTNWRKYGTAKRWSASETYAANDIVSDNNDNEYMAIAPSSSADPKNPTISAQAAGVWTPVDESLSWKPEQLKPTYTVGEVVSYDGILYENLSGNNASLNPRDNDSDWAPVHRVVTLNYDVTADIFPASAGAGNTITFTKFDGSTVDLTDYSEFTLWLNGVLIYDSQFSTNPTTVGVNLTTGTIVYYGIAYAGAKFILEATSNAGTVYTGADQSSTTTYSVNITNTASSTWFASASSNNAPQGAIVFFYDSGNSSFKEVWVKYSTTGTGSAAWTKFV